MTAEHFANIKCHAPNLTSRRTIFNGNTIFQKKFSFLKMVQGKLLKSHAVCVSDAADPDPQTTGKNKAASSSDSCLGLLCRSQHSGAQAACSDPPCSWAKEESPWGPSVTYTPNP